MRIVGSFAVSAHHEWWNSNIINPIRTEKLLDWIKLHKCKLINIPDEITRIQGTSKSVIDLTFASENIENSIINWAVDQESTGSDHEIIRFEIITNVNNLTNHAISIANQFNVDKADWKNYEIYLKTAENDVKNEINVQFAQKNFNKAVDILQNLMQSAMKLYISKTRICQKSKK